MRSSWSVILRDSPGLAVARRRFRCSDTGGGDGLCSAGRGRGFGFSGAGTKEDSVSIEGMVERGMAGEGKSRLTGDAA